MEDGSRRDLLRRATLLAGAPLRGKMLGGCVRFIDTSEIRCAGLRGRGAHCAVRAGAGVHLSARGVRTAWVGEDREVECPCHGSRFATDGTLLHPPATSGVPTYPASVDGQGNLVVQVK